MPFIVTAHSIKPGQRELYEKFLSERKVWFVRNIEGIKRYEIFITDHRMAEPDANTPADIKYDVVAIIECEDLEQLYEAYQSPSWQEFMQEYIHLLEDDPTLYNAHLVEQLDAKSKEAFWGDKK